eukprot:TRINITY_DN10187_c0_g1_i3.p1 TRINITY_DN10187_c0_g1~~TRINITY_DN10187_c0_g1_i3.p1  ORF type:complete len:191 (+),score=52.99 TRINITY_DN10187_c0_g1_i3:82-654(+)
MNPDLYSSVAPSCLSMVCFSTPPCVCCRIPNNQLGTVAVDVEDGIAIGGPIFIVAMVMGLLAGLAFVLRTPVANMFKTSARRVSARVAYSLLGATALALVAMGVFQNNLIDYLNTEVVFANNASSENDPTLLLGFWAQVIGVFLMLLAALVVFAEFVDQKLFDGDLDVSAPNLKVADLDQSVATNVTRFE